MTKRNAATRTAWIEVVKALGVALIGIIPGVLGTLYFTGNFAPTRGTTASGTQSPSLSPVVDAPQVYFKIEKTSLSLENCKAKADTAVSGAGLTGKINREFLTFGYSGQTTGVVWCDTDDRVIVFVGAGKNYDHATQVVEALHRSFPF